MNKYQSIKMIFHFLMFLDRAELEKKFSHLPIRNDSLTLRQTKEDIEKRIIALDEAIKIFSRPKVFIKNEE